MTYKHKTGPLRVYRAEELELFRKYRDERARFRPDVCVGGEKCWVEHGPPAITNRGYCLDCRGIAGELRRGRKVKVAR